MLTTSRPLPATTAMTGRITGHTSNRSFSLPRIKVAASSLLNRNDNRFTELRQQNLQRAACRLPEHVLRHIFELCASTTVGSPDSELSLASPRGRSGGIGSGTSTWSWVMITYVCHTWRQTALNFPELWRFVDFSHLRWSGITLSRSKMQSLCIHAVVGRHNLQQLHRTLQFAHQIESVRLDSSLHHIHGLLDTLVHPNPSLESITVRVNTAGHGVEGQVYPLPACPLVGPDLPAMQYLELHSAPFYLISERFISLKELHVYDLTTCERPTLHQFLSTLSKYTHLEHLTLENAFPLSTNSVPFPGAQPLSCSPSTSPFHSPSTSPPSAPSVKPCSPFRETHVTLPHLSTLSLTGTIPEITMILDSLTLPDDVSITCTITSLADWQQSVPKLAQTLNIHSWASATAGYAMETLVLSGIEEDAYPPAMRGVVYGGAHTVTPLTAKGVRIRGFNSQSSTTPFFDLAIGPDADPDFSSDEVMVHTLTAIWKALPLANVHTLVLHDFDIVTQKTWTQFLKNLPSLRVLDVTGHAPSGFVWALLLNADACIQREERERERREKREKKKLASLRGRSASPNMEGASPPLSPLPPTSPLTPAPSSSRMLFAPKLTDIYLHGVDCSSGGYMVAQGAPINSHWDLDDSRFLDVLLACLQMRSQAHWMLGTSPRSASTPLFSVSSRSGSPVLQPMFASTSKLRSLSLANCKAVPRHAAHLLKEFVAHCVWDHRGMLNEAEDNGLARYRKVGSDLTSGNRSPGAVDVHGYGKEGVRHYYRLKTLLDELEC
ncbi:hypothetical protein DFP72DRAFT_594261 [Ephemerocybe angulata]|uniref:F-box domain-containing protein n=1 Tax=Ephemerocybe angulata TaxID=980116 RepID=A0A8H6MAI8_9AGAR|nr:hypothetical protein DFP72DRAFT_594261 [Tulosesus angulatus]